MKTEEIIWVLSSGKIDYASKLHSKLIINKLKKSVKIRVIEPVYRNLLYNIYYRFIYLPILLMFNLKKTIILQDILFSYLLILAIKNAILMIHDFRTKSSSSVEKSDFGGRILFNMINIVAYRYVKYAKKIFTLSEYSKNIIVKELKVNPINVLLTGSPINTSEFTPLTKDKKGIKNKLLKKYGIPTNNNHLLCLNVGTSEPRKRLGFLLDSITNLDNVILVKIGKIDEGYQFNNVNTFNLGFVPEKDLIKFYQVSDLYIHPSNFEGFPRCSLEAHACGTNSLVFDIPLNREILDNTALYFKDSKKSFAKEISRFKKGNKINRTILIKNANKYSTTKVAKKVYDFLVKL